jgi:hypothetical protein
MQDIITGSMIGFVCSLISTVVFCYLGGKEKEESLGLGFATGCSIMSSMHFLNNILPAEFQPYGAQRNIGMIIFFGTLFSQIALMFLSRWWFDQKRKKERYSKRYSF